MGIRLKKKLTHTLERNFPLFEYTTICVNLCFYPNIQTSKKNRYGYEKFQLTLFSIYLHMYISLKHSIPSHFVRCKSVIKSFEIFDIFTLKFHNKKIHDIGKRKPK